MDRCPDGEAKRYGVNSPNGMESARPGRQHGIQGITWAVTVAEPRAQYDPRSKVGLFLGGH